MSLIIITIFLSCNKTEEKIIIDNNEQAFANENKSKVIEVKVGDAVMIMQNRSSIQSYADTSYANDNIINELVYIFSNRSPGTSLSELPYRRNTPKSNVTSLDEIIPVQGYYIQQDKRRSSYGHSPEILLLIVENEKVFIREIDILNEQVIIRNEILLNFDGNTYAHNNSKLEIQDNKIQIIYHEHKPEQYGRERWDFDMPYTFSGDIKSPIPSIVQKLTTDYMLTLTGDYILDSFEIINRENEVFETGSINRMTIRILYNQEKKCLTIYNDFTNMNDPRNRKFQQYDFVVTAANEPFYWLFGESSGYLEIILFFYKGGIAILHDKTLGFYMGDDEYKNNILKYVMFFK